MTIVEAIKTVMRRAGRPLGSREIYEAIIEEGLYIFLAKNPQHVVLSQIRRHCVGIDFPTASPAKHFTLHENKAYFLLPGLVLPTVDSKVGTSKPRLTLDFQNAHVPKRNKLYL